MKKTLLTVCAVAMLAGCGGSAPGGTDLPLQVAGGDAAPVQGSNDAGTDSAVVQGHDDADSASQGVGHCPCPDAMPLGEADGGNADAGSTPDGGCAPMGFDDVSLDRMLSTEVRGYPAVGMPEKTSYHRMTTWSHYPGIGTYGMDTPELAAKLSLVFINILVEGVHPPVMVDMRLTNLDTCETVTDRALGGFGQRIVNLESPGHYLFEVSYNGKSCRVQYTDVAGEGQIFSCGIK